MLIGITGTPGCGKTTAAETLRRRGFPVCDLKTTTGSFVVGNEDGADIIDTDAWAASLAKSGIDGFVEGALAHYLPCDKIIVLRCRPDVLKERLSPRGYSPEKIRENAEAEAIDVILIEAAEAYNPEQLFEIDTTNITTEKTADLILDFAEGRLPAAFGSIDWSEYVMSL